MAMTIDFDLNGATVGDIYAMADTLKALHISKEQTLDFDDGRVSIRVAVDEDAADADNAAGVDAHADDPVDAEAEPITAEPINDSAGSARDAQFNPSSAQDWRKRAEALQFDASNIADAVRQVVGDKAVRSVLDTLLNGGLNGGRGNGRGPSAQ